MAEAAVKVVEQSAPAQTISGGHLVAKALRAVEDLHSKYASAK